MLAKKVLSGFLVSCLLCFNTFSQDSITDIDGYEYNTVQIGNQTWLKENLRVTKYNDGTPIQLIDNPADTNSWNWGGPAKCTYYDVNLYLERTYGKLYNGYVVRSEKNVCPVGWKIPTDYELTELVLQADPNADTDSLLWGDQSFVAANKLISSVDSANGGGGTDDFGFSLLMSGVICAGLEDLAFSNINSFTLLWSTTPAHEYEGDRNYTKIIGLNYIGRYKTHIDVGAPIRCLKDVNYDPSAQIEEIKIDYVVYPNPVVDQLNVVVDQSSIGTEYTISDMNGKILMKDQIPSQEFKIDMSGLSGGVYKIEIGGSVKLINK
jgi:uncharacterized protein (TIGR02145 family)